MTTIPAPTFSSASIGNGTRSLVPDSNFLYATETNLKSNPFNNLGLTVRAAFDNFVIKNQTWPSLFSIYRNVQDNNSSVHVAQGIIIIIII
jgi:hypothetical protein